ncbi:MAG: ATP-dependent DNA helicase UvrD2, partial [Acidimicrobiales bacterium]
WDGPEAPAPRQAGPAAAPARRGPVPTVAGGADAVEVLGRSLVVGPGGAVPAPWSACERVGVTDLGDAGTLTRLEAAWRDRTPLVIELTSDLGLDDAEHPPADVVDLDRTPVATLGPWFSPLLDRWHHALWANAADGRGPGAPTWRWAGEAVARRATAHDGPAADVVLADGIPVWCDGGPIGPVEGAAVVHRVAIEHGSLTPFGTGAPTAELAPDQLAAVAHRGGAARIVAPAGSGKTRVLTERARHLLGEWALPASAVCLVAFNVRAREELQARTTDLPRLHIRTLNSLGLAIVDGAPPFGARRRGLAVLGERDVRQVLDGLVTFPRRAATDPAAAWIEALSSARLGLRDPLEVEADFGGDVDGLVDVLPRYRAALAARGAVDFDEQIIGAVEVLLTDTGARERARRACRVLLVDEFQDLTPAHLLLIRLLAGPDGAVVGVGDDDQTIYGYAGASPEWLLRFATAFPTAGDQALEVNYRCPPAVVEAAANLLTRNRRRVAKVIRPAPGRPVEPDALRVVDGGDDPVAATVAEVGTRLAAGAAPADVAVLTRVNSVLAPVQVALRHEGVPVMSAVDAGFLERSGVRAALAWLRVGVAASTGARLRGVDLAAAVRRPSRGVSSKLVEWIGEQRTVADLRRLAGRLSRDRDAEKVDRFADDIALVAGAAGGSSTAAGGSSTAAGGSSTAAGGGSSAAMLRAVRDQVGLDDAAMSLDGAHRRLDRSAHIDDLDALVALARLHHDPDGFEGWLRDALDVAPDPDGVRLATIHSVKGREWPHVVVHHATAGLLPHRLVADVEEERRVFHVGLTRGRDTVAIVHGRPASPFVGELALPGEPPPERARPPAVASRGAPEHRREPAPATGDPGLVEALKAWRSGMAKAEGKPAYVYLTDATIDAIATARPAGMAGLARIKGIGPAKLERYGDELLAVLDAAT